MSLSTEDITIITNPQNVQIAIEQPSGEVNIATYEQYITLSVGATVQTGTGTFVIGEIPTGAVDGSNAIFYSLTAFTPESVQVFINGVNQINGIDFSTNGTTQILLNVSPVIGDYIRINYKRGN
jgi:hypothetical protein